MRVSSLLLLLSASAVAPEVSARTAPATVEVSDACEPGYVARGDGCVHVSEATDKEIRQHLVRRSLASYSGNCPCPYNRDRAGRRCGRRSAYSRPGGASPLCYERDISDAQVRRLRERYPAPLPDFADSKLRTAV